MCPCYPSLDILLVHAWAILHWQERGKALGTDGVRYLPDGAQRRGAPAGLSSQGWHTCSTPRGATKQMHRTLSSERVVRGAVSARDSCQAVPPWQPALKGINKAGG